MCRAIFRNWKGGIGPERKEANEEEEEEEEDVISPELLCNLRLFFNGARFIFTVVTILFI